jgi:hypothetical protein
MIAFLPASTAVSIFSPKYLIVTYPAIVAFLAFGVVSLARRWRALGRVALAGLLGLGGWAHTRDLTDPNAQRENWAFVADYLAQHAEPTDRIIVFADYIKPVLEWHFKGPNESLRFDSDPLRPSAFFDAVQVGTYRNLWLILAHDRIAQGNHQLVDVATARYPWLRAEYPNLGFIRVLEYGLRWRYDVLPDRAARTDVAFENGVRLVGYRVEESVAPATDRISHPPSNWVHVVAYWQRNGVVAPDHARPYVRMVSPDGGEWGGDLVRIPTVFEFDPPKGWPEDAIIESHHDVNLTPITPAGNYAMVIGLVQDNGVRIKQRTNAAATGATVAPMTILGR